MRHCIYISILGLLISMESIACSCDTSSVYESFENSAYIFIGQIVKAEFVDYTDTIFDQPTLETDYKYTFDVIEQFKGDSISEIEIRTYYGSSCHFPMTHGEYYLVYSYNWKGHQRTGMCTRTKDWDNKMFKYDRMILLDLKVKNSMNQYRDGFYQSKNKNSYFKFYNSGRFYFRNIVDHEAVHGKGQYIFNGDSLILDFGEKPKNESKHNYNIFPDTLEYTTIKIQSVDYDFNTPIVDFNLKITDKSNSVIFEKQIPSDTLTIRLDKKHQLDTLCFEKTGYPIFKTDFYGWDSRDLHIIKIKWQEEFDIIANQKVICKLKDDNITEFEIMTKDKKNTGYNTQYSKLGFR